MKAQDKHEFFFPWRISISNSHITEQRQVLDEFLSEAHTSKKLLYYTGGIGLSNHGNTLGVPWLWYPDYTRIPLSLFLGTVLMEKEENGSWRDTNRVSWGYLRAGVWNSDVSRGQQIKQGLKQIWSNRKEGGSFLPKGLPPPPSSSSPLSSWRMFFWWGHIFIFLKQKKKKNPSICKTSPFQMSTLRRHVAYEEFHPLWASISPPVTWGL